MWIIVTLIVVLLVFITNIYNKLVKKRNETNNAFAQIDVQLKRRYEIIPNLVTLAKKYMEHEKETLTAVTFARNHAAQTLEQVKKNPNGNKVLGLAAAEGALSHQLGALYATFESYPDLKADKEIAALREEIVSAENRITFARQYFNDCVTDYNDALQIFPQNVIASAFHFQPQELLEFDNKEEMEKPLRITL